MSVIKAIIFDCFGVLYVHHGPEYLKNNVANYDDLRYQIDEIIKAANYNFISAKEGAEKLAELTNLPTEDLKKGLARGFGMNRPLVEYIQTSLRLKYKVAMFSNTSWGTMDKYFSKKERQRYFDLSVVSAETGLVKPNPSAYIDLCQRLGVDVSEAMMIDDNAENCRGAEMAGLAAIRYDGLVHLKRALESKLADTNN
ncbi:MAG: HAD-IA family hydrolase [Prolixibacteraceae bacterium]|nr:HAD-IA family hydrolase [Prolixibacteraceae bacterium]